MSVEIFSKEQFEAALPNTVSWKCLGLKDGEFAYKMQINDDIFIQIRSSVKANGFSADTGQDSIRAWLVDNNGKPLGSKVLKWTQRIPGWEERMLDVLRILWKRAQWAGYCPDCKIPMGVFKSKTKKNPNRLFKKCTNENCKHDRNHFEWWR